jgi:hypothetical protein
VIVILAGGGKRGDCANFCPSPIDCAITPTDCLGDWSNSLGNRNDCFLIKKKNRGQKMRYKTTKHLKISIIYLI